MNAMAGRTRSLSLWHAVSRNRRDRPALQGALDVDLAIVGGGFSGLSTALHAAEKGLSVAVLEAEIIAWGATGRNAGFVVPNFAKRDPDDIIAHLGPERGERLIDFAAGSADLVFGLIKRHGIECDAVQSGWIQPAHSPAAFEKIKSRAEQWARRGRPAVTLDRQDVEALTGVRGYVGGWMDRSGGVLNPVEYARGLADAAEKAGARIFEHTPVTSIDRIGGWLDVEDGIRLGACRKGADRHQRLWRVAEPDAAANLLSAEGLPDRDGAAAARNPHAPACPAGKASATPGAIFSPSASTAENRLISGGMHILGAGADTRVPRTIWRRLARHLDLPELPPLDYSWSGMAAVEPDFLPHLVDLGPGLIAGFACNGRGIAMTTAMGKVLADWAAGTDAAGSAAAVCAAGADPVPRPAAACAKHAARLEHAARPAGRGVAFCGCVQKKKGRTVKSGQG